METMTKEAGHEAATRGRLTVCRAALALAVIAVVVADNEGVGIDSVLDGAAEAVTRETHCCCCWGVESG